MAMKNQRIAEAQSVLVDRLGEVCKMNREQLFAELPKVCEFKADYETTDKEIIYVLMKFAIFSAFPKK